MTTDADLAGEQSSVLFESNMRAFKEHFPEVASQLESITVRVSTRLPPPQDNISIDGTLLYPTGASEWVKLQMEGAEEFGERISVDVGYSNVSEIGLPLMEEISKYCQAENISLSPTRMNDIGFHLVFGIGLGYHVPLLVETTASRTLILIEPVPEFLLHAMEVVDWTETFRRAAERNVKIVFILSDTPTVIARAIESEVIFNGRPFLDGTPSNFNYYSWPLREAYTLFRERRHHIEMNSGFFEDEMVMMTNAFNNFAHNAFHQLAGKRYIAQKTPLFVCGSGPSLRTTIPEIQKWRDHVVLMSCGTSLGPLLEAGLRPDFHCENENVAEVYNILSKLEQKHGFHGITLIATSTVQVNVPPLFEHTWFYQRGALTASTILAPDVTPVSGVDPLVSNAGFSVGATLGFNTIYLFGTDCGAKRIDDHHVGGAYKFQSEEDKRKHDEMWAQRFDRQVPGNFGGKVHSAWHLDLSRRLFEEAQQVHQVELYNCSDGARITGAKPKAPRSLKFNAPVDAQRVLANIGKQMACFEKGEFVKTIAFDATLQALDEYCAWINTAMAEARTGNGSFYDLHKKMTKVPEENRKAWKKPESFIASTVVAMLWLAAYFGDRIKDADTRRAYFDFAMDRIDERLTLLFAGAKDFLLDLQAQAQTIATTEKDAATGK